jgi:hypothetical protein
MRLLAFAAVALLLVACGKDEPAKGGGTPAPHTHGVGPNGGEVLDLQDGYHLEMIHDHDGGNVTVFVLDEEAKTRIAIPKPVMNVATKSGPAEVSLAPVDPKGDGTAESWKGSHEGLKADPWDGRIRVTVAGKTYQSSLEAPGHAPK